MRKHRFFWRALPYVLTSLLLISGCGTSTNQGKEDASSVPSSESTATATDGTGTTENGEDTMPEQAVLAKQISEVFATPVTAVDTTSNPNAIGLKHNFGGMKAAPKDMEAEVIDEEQKAEISRTMRAYSNQTSAEIINNAKSYYVYDKLNKEEKNLYDALYLLAQDPTTSDNYVSFQTGLDVQGEEFWSEVFVAEISVVYDHPELWWVYPFSNCAQIGFYYGSDPGAYNGKTLLYANFYTPYSTFESDVKAFNNAVQSFFSDINVNADEEEVAQAIHDKLIDLCTYDNEVLEKDLSDKAHTAFGAIVKNSRGTANYCVCDGYAQAYLYLLQQAGIEGAVVIGMAGDAAADGGMGAHAWSLVNLNDVWYEVDACWDDLTSFEDEIAEYYQAGSMWYQYEMEMASDPDYQFMAYHNMYGLSTAEIQDFKVTDDLIYVTRDGKYELSMMGDSQRWRMDEDTNPNNADYGLYTKVLPKATHTLDRKTLRSNGQSGSGNGSGGGSGNSGSDSDSGNTSSGGDTGSGSSQETTEVRGPLYQLIAGTYYVSAFNNYDEAFLKKNYGKDYYKQLSMFELRTDASGTLYENGTSAEFYYVFDGSQLCMYSATMGMVFLYYDNGNLKMYDYYGNVYTFSRMK